MSYKIDISHQDGIVHVRVYGTINEVSIRELWRSIVAACETHQCFDILGVSELERPFSTMDAFSHVEAFQDAGVTHRHRIAWVSGDAASEDILRFTETVLVNRGQVNGHVFSTTEEARAWLADKPDEV